MNDTPNSNSLNDDLAPAEETTVTSNGVSGDVDDLAPADVPEDDTPSDDLLKSGEAEEDDDGEEKPLLKSKEGQKDGKPQIEPTFKYDYEIPENVKDNFDQKGFDEFKDFAKEHQLPDHVAQQLLNKYFDNMTQFVAGTQQAQEAKKAEDNKLFHQQVRADPEIGGKNLPKTVDYASRAIDFGGGKAVEKVLHEYGLQNHPVLLKAFARIGQALGEGEPVHTESKQATKQSQKSIVDMYFSD